MELRQYITQLDSVIDGFDGLLAQAGREIAEEYIEDVQSVTPVETGDLRDSWELKTLSTGAGMVELLIEADPVHRGSHYASEVEEYYDTHDSNARGGNAGSFMFRKLKEAAWQVKVDEKLQRKLEIRLQQSI